MGSVWLPRLVQRGLTKFHRQCIKLHCWGNCGVCPDWNNTYNVMGALEWSCACRTHLASLGVFLATRVQETFCLCNCDKNALNEIPLF